MTTVSLSTGIQYSSGQEEPAMVCFRCGVCCARYPVRLSLVEERCIADELGLAWEEWRDRYVDQRQYRPDSFLLRRRDGACVFLERIADGNQTRCLIHPFKPSVCQSWTPSLYRWECREGLSKYWGLTVSPSGQLQGPQQKLRNFCSFVESLMVAGNRDAGYEFALEIT